MRSIMPPMMLSAATNDGARAAYCTTAAAVAGAVGTPCTGGGGGCIRGNSCLALSSSVGFSFPSAWSGMLLPASTSTRYLELSVPSEKTDDNTRLSICKFCQRASRWAPGTRPPKTNNRRNIRTRAFSHATINACQSERFSGFLKTFSSDICAASQRREDARHLTRH